MKLFRMGVTYKTVCLTMDDPRKKLGQRSYPMQNERGKHDTACVAVFQSSSSDFASPPETWFRSVSQICAKESN